ncbi:MAG: RNA polymerase sigma factor [Planctomycetes bacterium]|nr:RNA polymerase sigma factor [Planctomycetota bacterium]
MAKHDEPVSPEMDFSRNGQESPDERLVRTFNDIKDELISALVFVLGNREDAKDAAQDAFIKCWNARDQLPKVINLRAWIFRVCFNTAKDMQRSAWHRRSRPLQAEQYTMATKDAGPGQSLERKESIEQLRLAILELREEEKEVFLLRQAGELTYEEIAEMRGCPVSTVKTQMRSALEKLRKVLNPAESVV